MALVVNTTTSAINAQNKLSNTTNSLSNVFQRISSGLRINKAADDAAGLGVSESLDSEIRAFKQGIRNANDGISIIQTAEGAANEVANILKRMRELAVQSSSETMATDERAYIDDEFEQLSAEVERIAQTTTFNGMSLATNVTSSNGDGTITIQVGGANNSNDRIDIALGDLEAQTLGVSYTAAGTLTQPNHLNLNTTTNSQSALTRLDVALNSVNAYRSTFGAIQNRLESAIRNLTNYTENLSSAKSRIVDADFAHETAQLAKFQILQQSGVAVLGQANAVSQAALRLLG
jgi:flagellin